ncbi:MAG: DUF2976 domain-containing protein [Rhodocyclaceae bacterium]|nr:DUF2976 domain-containing protein [Rhodocyclaceae bacterium]
MPSLNPALTCVPSPLTRALPAIDARGFFRLLIGLALLALLMLFADSVFAALPQVAPNNNQNLQNGDVIGFAKDYTDQTINYGSLIIGAILLLLGGGGLVTKLYFYSTGRGGMGDVLAFGALAVLVAAVGIYFLTQADAVF